MAGMEEWKYLNSDAYAASFGGMLRAACMEATKEEYAPRQFTSGRFPKSVLEDHLPEWNAKTGQLPFSQEMLLYWSLNNKEVPPGVMTHILHVVQEQRPDWPQSEAVRDGYASLMSKYTGTYVGVQETALGKIHHTKGQYQPFLRAAAEAMGSYKNLADAIEPRLQPHELEDANLALRPLYRDLGSIDVNKFYLLPAQFDAMAALMHEKNALKPEDMEPLTHAYHATMTEMREKEILRLQIERDKETGLRANPKPETPTLDNLEEALKRKYRRGSGGPGPGLGMGGGGRGAYPRDPDRE